MREQQIYQTRDPLTKAEEQLFEGTLSEKKNEEQPVFSETKQEIAEQKTAEYLKTAVDSEGNRKQIEQNKNVISEEIRPQQLELFEEKLLAPESRSRHQLIGQIFDTYWLVQFEDKFFIIDQHAAHEKVYYERFVKRFREQTVESQYLSPPLIVSLNLQEEAMTEMFSGVRNKEEKTFTVRLTPDKEFDNEVAFRFSKKLGIVANNDLAGTPFYISLKDLKTVKIPQEDGKKKKEMEGIAYNVPGQAMVTLTDGKKKLYEGEIPVTQFGIIEYLAPVLFNKNSTIKVYFDPVTGGLLKVDREESK